MLRTLIGGAIAAALLAGCASAAEEPAAVKAGKIPGDARIVFSSGRGKETDPWGQPSKELYVANLEGQVTRITYSRYVANHFTVSPDRKKIAVNRYSRGDTNGDGQYFPMNDFKELWIVDVETGTERRVAPHIDAGFGGLAWAPDSRHLYFSTPTRPGVMDIRRVDTETGEDEIVTAGLNALLGEKDERKFVSDVDVSPDGEWLVFVYVGPEMIASGATQPRIAVMKLDGSEAHIVSSGGPAAPGKRGVWSTGDYDPDFGPDGTTIAFARLTEDGYVTADLSTFAIITINRDGTGEKRITPVKSDTAFYIPSWNEENLIIFTEASPKTGLTPVIYNPEDGSTRRVTVSGEAGHVQWIPNGN